MYRASGIHATAWQFISSAFNLFMAVRIKWDPWHWVLRKRALSGSKAGGHLFERVVGREGSESDFAWI